MFADVRHHILVCFYRPFYIGDIRSSRKNHFISHIYDLDVDVNSLYESQTDNYNIAVLTALEG